MYSVVADSRKGRREPRHHRANYYIHDRGVGVALPLRDRHRIAEKNAAFMKNTRRGSLKMEFHFIGEEVEVEYNCGRHAWVLAASAAEKFHSSFGHTACMLGRGSGEGKGRGLCLSFMFYFISLIPTKLSCRHLIRQVSSLFVFCVLLQKRTKLR